MVMLKENKSEIDFNIRINLRGSWLTRCKACDQILQSPLLSTMYMF